MQLIDIYIQEVTRRLPEKNREDIALELRSTIEDMLPDNYSKDDVKVVLEKLGNPVLLASGYRDQPMHLIGPRYFDAYVTLLKMILPIASVISLLTVIAEYFIGYGGEEALINGIFTIIGEGIGRIIEVGIQTFFWLTLVFAIIERTDKGKDDQTFKSWFSKWTADELNNIPYIPKQKAITKFEVFGSLMWTAIWATLYFNANYLVGIYKSSSDGLKFVTPFFNQDVILGYWLIILIVIGFEIALALYKLIEGQWTKGMAICNAIFEFFGSIVFIALFINPNVINRDFIIYMTNLFSISAKQFETWIIVGGIFIYLLFAIINVFDGFRKARIR